jgi:pimeloyl-ACP methyl ester carboxylesterase
MNTDSAAQTAKINNKNISFRKVGSGKRKILFFHGFPGSSSQIEPFRDQATAFDLEVICVDRPGYHKTELTQGRQFDQATQMMKSLLDSFGWQSCEVMSVSGGTPFLFSFTQAFPQFISNVTVISGLGPVGNKEFQQFLSWKARFVLKLLPKLPGSFLERVLPKYKPQQVNAVPAQPKFNIIRYLLPGSPADAKVMLDLKIQDVLGRALHEAFMQKGTGPKRDAAEYIKPWSLELKGYAGPIKIWHGDEDQILPLGMAEQMAKLIPRAQLNVLNNEGHYSLIIKRMENILKQ